MTACNAVPFHRSSQLRALLETGCEWFRRRHPTRRQRGWCTFHLCRRMIAHSQAKQFVVYLLLGQGSTRETILYAAILPRLLYDCPYSRPYNTRAEKSPCPSGQLPPKEKDPAVSDWKQTGHSACCIQSLQACSSTICTNRSAPSPPQTTPAGAHPLWSQRWL
jgi:hypothetical protein